MNAIGRLGQLYNLSPGTIAGLANVAGAQPPANDYEAEFAADQEEQRQFAAANGLPEVKPLAPPPTTEDGSHLYTDPSANSKAAGQQLPQIANGPLGYEAGGASPKTPEQLAQEAADREGYDAARSGGPPAATAYATSATPAVTVPAHWQPGTHAVAVQHGLDPAAFEPGKQSREDALVHGVASADLHRAAALMQGEIDGAYSAGRARVEQQTADQIQAIQARKTKMIADEHAKLDALNAEASKKIDTSEAFVGGDVGRLGAAIAMGIGQFAAIWKGGSNAAMQIVNDAVDSTIKRQQANINNARGAIAERRSLLRDNLDALGDEERAVLATKMQLLNSIAADAEAKRATGPKTVEAEAAYHDFMRGLKNDYAAYQDRYGEATTAKVSEQMNEHFVPTQTYGGGASNKREGNLVTLSDGTTFVMPSEKVAQDAIGKVQTLGQLQRFNNEILALRQKAYALNPVTDRTEFNAVMSRLGDLGEQKAALVSKSLEQGVLKDSEYERAMEKNVGVSKGLGIHASINPLSTSDRKANDAMLRAQTKRWGEDQRSHVTAAGGSVYERGYASDAAGQLKPVGRYTGQDASPTEYLPPNGTRAIDRRQELPTAGPKVSTTIPQAPRFGTSPTPAPSAPKSKKGHR